MSGRARRAAAALVVALTGVGLAPHGALAKPAFDRGGKAKAAAAKAKPKAKAAQAMPLTPDEARLLELVNAYRKSFGLATLTVYPTLLTEARWYAQDMAFNDAFTVTHIDSLGRTIDQRFSDFGYPILRPLGQATASGGQTPEETFEQLRVSRLHDEIMRDPRFRLAGMGVGVNDRTDSKRFWVMSFARDDPRKTAKPKTSSRKATAARMTESRRSAQR
ncbi:CAP domain-containing protein [Conexibacter sp. SYSU D00693]|uniref:CAP domain-containing protein n=1 Tax=Conexibacter sp. SYSU D00693 TaxID=2812560 RepID=UPI00196A6C89|nr:CAP domain-containing protein [Conexibacter sp. SYSU D00693]